MGRAQRAIFKAFACFEGLKSRKIFWPAGAHARGVGRSRRQRSPEVGSHTWVRPEVRLRGGILGLLFHPHKMTRRRPCRSCRVLLAWWLPLHAHAKSQGAQDDTLARIFAAVGTTNRHFVEFGFNGRSFEEGLMVR